MSYFESISLIPESPEHSMDYDAVEEYEDDSDIEEIPEVQVHQKELQSSRQGENRQKMQESSSEIQSSGGGNTAAAKEQSRAKQISQRSSDVVASCRGKKTGEERVREWLEDQRYHSDAPVLDVDSESGGRRGGRGCR